MPKQHSCSEDVQKLVASALHQIRTRALRDAPVYLQHVSAAENELQQSIADLIATYGDQRELEGLKSFVGGNNKYGRDSAYSEVPFYVIEERDYIERIKELEAKLAKR